MDPSEIPERSALWFGQKSQQFGFGQLFDQITIVVTVALSLFSLVVFWPIIAQIEFEEAFFTPLLPAVITALGYLGLTPSAVLRLLFITSFVASTAGFYLLVRVLTRRQITPILAAVIYTLPPVPVFVLTFLRQGLLEAELSAARSFFSIVYGDGAHFLALALIPVAAIFFLRYIKLGRVNDLVVTALITTLVLLANRSQSLSLFLVFLVVVATELFLGSPGEKFKRFWQVLLLSIGLASFWYTPEFLLKSFWLLGRHMAANIDLLLPLPLVMVVILLFFSYAFFAKREDRQPIFVAFLLLIVFLIIVGGWLFYGRSLLPYPYRFLANLNMFGSIVLALGITAVIDKLHLVEALHFANWPASLKVVGALAFGLFSFLGLALVAFFLSPLAILAVAGPSSIWSRVRLSVLAEREETLRVAGGAFELASPGGESWQVAVGILISLIFLGVCGWLVFKPFDSAQGKSSKL